MKITHIITGLHVGGAERTLLQLLQHSSTDRYQHNVISMIPEGPLAAVIRDLGIGVRALSMARTVPNPAKVLALVSAIRSQRPDIVQTWMYHANLFGGIAAKLAQVPTIVWGLHHSDLTPRNTGIRTVAVSRLCGLSAPRLCDGIVCCAPSTRTVHGLGGYPESMLHVIPNGVECSHFTPSSRDRDMVRTKLALRETDIVFGVVGRFSPQKDHRNFFRAAEIVRHRHPNAAFVLAGQGVTRDNPQFMAIVGGKNGNNRYRLLGRRDDIRNIYPAFDALCLSSAWEAFPLVLCEAMACGVPCVATDVGDCRTIVGDTGLIVPARDAQALATAMLDLAEMPQAERRVLGGNARRRIVENFDARRMTTSYFEYYERLSARATAA